MTNNNFDLKSFCGGMVGGSFGTFLGHPSDTIRVRYQSDVNKVYKNLIDCTKQIYREKGIRGFYQGIYAPLFGIGIEKCIVFGTYSNAKNMNIFKNEYGNIFFGGVISGICCTSIVTPVEKIKIKMQNNSDSKKLSIYQTIKQENIKSLYRGWTATLFREVPGYGIYFATYEYLKTKVIDQKPYHTMIFGGLSGLNAWLFIYPSDPIKTLMQNENIGLKESTKKIYSMYGIKGFYKGFSMGLFRSIPLHAGVFLGYETFMKLL